jgi:hypothetical protein
MGPGRVEDFANRRRECESPQNHFFRLKYRSVATVVADIGPIESRSVAKIEAERAF